MIFYVIKDSNTYYCGKENTGIANLSTVNALPFCVLVLAKTINPAEDKFIVCNVPLTSA